MSRLVAAIAVLGSVGSLAHADQPTAAAAFKEAEALAKEGKWSEACPLYDASYRSDPQIGVLLHLADCHERIGRTATAWAEFSDAAELTHDKHDPRETTANARANALLPKLAKLHLTAPTTPVPGLSVRRDEIDITAFVGRDVPIDPGDHEVVARAPGFVEWKTTVTIARPGTTPIQIPDLAKAAERIEPVETKRHEGRLVVVTQPGATIRIDSIEVGNGRFEGSVASGGHTLRVVAKGMRPYQSEISITDDQIRTIEAPLEPDVAVAAALPAAARQSPRRPGLLAGWGVEAGAGIARAPKSTVASGPETGPSIFAGVSKRIGLPWRLAVVPELALTVKGGRYAAFGGMQDVNLSLSYFELPVTVRVQVGDRDDAHAEIGAGMYVAWGFDAHFSDGNRTPVDGFSAVDVGLVACAGAGIGRLTLGGRFEDSPFVDIADGLTGNTYVFIVTLAFELR